MFPNVRIRGYSTDKHERFFTDMSLRRAFVQTVAVLGGIYCMLQVGNLYVRYLRVQNKKEKVLKPSNIQELVVEKEQVSKTEKNHVRIPTDVLEKSIIKYIKSISLEDFTRNVTGHDVLKALFYDHCLTEIRQWKQLVESDGLQASVLLSATYQMLDHFNSVNWNWFDRPVAADRTLKKLVKYLLILQAQTNEQEFKQILLRQVFQTIQVNMKPSHINRNESSIAIEDLARSRMKGELQEIVNEDKLIQKKEEGNKNNEFHLV